MVKQMGNQKQAGSSLVEVMIALFVLAIGLLGVLAMQSKSMQYNQSAHTYSQAVYLANDIAERIRNNFAKADTYDGDIATTQPTTRCDTDLCGPAELANWDKYEWAQRVEQALPLGKATIVEVAGNAETNTPAHLKVTVSFDDSRVEGNVSRQEYSLVVEI